MSPSTAANGKPRIPFQPNPFGSSALGSPWAGELADVPGINRRPFALILDALRQMRAGGRGTSIVLIGEPGSGKTHLLGRLRNQLRQDELTIYAYLRCNASAGTLWRHLRYALASDLLRGTEGSQLNVVFARDSASDRHRLESVNHRGLRRVIECLRDGSHFHAASAWLRGELLGDADMAALGLAVEKEDEDHNRERDAKLVVDALLGFLAPTPVVLCFDQVEALETYRGEEAGYHALGQMISALYDGHDHLLLISCVIAEYEVRVDSSSSQADKDRWLQHKDTIRPIGWDQAVELIKVRLDLAPALKSARAAHANDPIWPIDASKLKPLFGATDLCLPRKLIRACEHQFRELMGDEPAPEPKDRDKFVQEEFDSNLSEARRTVSMQGLSKTLSDCLPWLLQSSGLRPLGRDEARSRYAAQGWRGAGGDMAIAFCDGGGNALTNQLKRIEREWSPRGLKLALVRDISIQPGAVGERTLTSLRHKGAREIHPLPEALAALQAIRNLIATARSGELLNGDELVDEEAVTAWALANLPPQVEQLRDALMEREPEPEDPVLPRLSELLNERKIIAADNAAAELNLRAEEVSKCARLYPMRFGFLDGPPMVIFEAAEGPSR